MQTNMTQTPGGPTHLSYDEACELARKGVPLQFFAEGGFWMDSTANEKHDPAERVRCLCRHYAYRRSVEPVKPDMQVETPDQPREVIRMVNTNGEAIRRIDTADDAWEYAADGKNFQRCSSTQAYSFLEEVCNEIAAHNRKAEKERHKAFNKFMEDMFSTVDCGVHTFKRAGAEEFAPGLRCTVPGWRLLNDREGRLFAYLRPLEKERIYSSPSGVTTVIANPAFLHVYPCGAHLVVTSSGGAHLIVDGESCNLKLNGWTE